jgi:pimeloyl-ACP methyl ester carboxylesterase
MADATKKPALRWRRAGKIAAWVVGVIVGLLALALAYAYLAPVPVSTANPNPAKSYAEAVARIKADQATDPQDVGYPSLFFGQGSQTTTAVVLFHGLTNNPYQWRIVAEGYARRGYNVWVPREPQHGAKNRMTDWLAGLTTSKLTDYGDSSIDIAAGLGKNVEVVGLSGGATVAAWAAQNRDEVRSAVLIAPFFKPASIPLIAMKPLYQLTPKLPPIWMWWDDVNKDQRITPPYSYPRYALAALSAYLAMADNVDSGPYTSKTPLDSVTLITNGNDAEIDVGFALAAVKRTLGPHTLKWVFYEFPASLGYKHDIISPEGDNRLKVPAIYRKLYPLLGLPASDAPTSAVAP